MKPNSFLKYLLFALLQGITAVSTGIFAQTTHEFDILIESIFEDLDENTAPEAYIEKLWELYENPLELNSVELPQLEELPFLNDMQIHEFLVYRKIYGKIFSIYELLLIKGFNKKTAAQLAPFVRIETKELKGLNFKRAIRYGRQKLLIRNQIQLPLQVGFTEPDGYLGNANKQYLRFSHRYKQQLFFGLTAEKDAGETLQNGYDHYAFHLMVKDVKNLKALVVGDYRIEAGQGLVAGSAFGSGKSSMVTNVRRSSKVISKYGSAGEFGYLKGLAGTYKLGNAKVTGFVSYQAIDANVAEFDDSGKPLRFSSLQITGLHNTESSLEQKNSIRQFVTGSVLSYRNGNYKLGLNALHASYNAEFVPDNTAFYKVHGFRGKQNTNASIDYTWYVRQMYFFGEAAISEKGATALLFGANIHPNEATTLVFAARNYEPDYYATFAGGFGEQSNTQNEKGLYSAIKFQLPHRVEVSAYLDTYRFPWASFTHSLPTVGTDGLVAINWGINRKTHLLLQYKNEQKPTDVPATYERKNLTAITGKEALKLILNFIPMRGVSLKTRLETSRFRFGEDAPERGYYLFQDVAHKPEFGKLSWYLRYGIFDTDSYNTRIYAYENDVLYAFSVPAVYGKGIRTYAMLKYEPTEQIDIWLKIAETIFTDREVIGTGKAQITSNKKTEIKLQIQFKF